MNKDTRRRRPRSSRRLEVATGLAIRSLSDIVRELRRRHGWNMSVPHVSELLTRAEDKLRRRLAQEVLP